MFVFFFKQKTAYEMRISDWSSDVCSSDLSLLALAKDKGLARIDHVVLSGKSELVRSPGQNILVVQGKLEDPAHIRAHMDTGLDARTTVQESRLNLEATKRRLAGAKIDIPAAARQKEHAQTAEGPTTRV